MRVPGLGIDDVEGPLAALQPFDDERNEDVIRLAGTIDEQAGVALALEFLACQANAVCPGPRR